MAQACRKHSSREAISFCVKCGCPMCPECERPFDGRPYCAECLKKQKSGDRAPKAVARATATGSAAEGEKPKFQFFAAIKSAGRIAGGVSPAAGMTRIPKEVRRVVARLLDFALVAAFSAPVSWLFRIITRPWMSDVGGIGYDLSIYFSVLLVSTAYFMAAEWRFGKTLGKWLLGLKVVSYADGSRLTFGAVCLRWIGLLASLIWAYVGCRVGYLTMGLMGIFRQGIPFYSTVFCGFIAIVIAVIFSLGLLMTFVGKYKRGFHDLLARSIVEDDKTDEKITERGKASGSKS